MSATKVHEPTELDIFVRDWLVREANWKPAIARSLAGLGAKMQLSKTQIVHIRNGQKFTTGEKTQVGFAKLIAGGSVDDLRKMASEYCRATHQTRTVPDRYPSRASLLKRLAGLLPDEVLSEVAGEAHKEAEGWSEREWLLEVADVLREWRRRQRQTPEEAAEDRRRGAADTSKAVKRTRPRIPKKRA